MTFKPIKYRAHNGYDTEEASNQAAINCETFGPSLTVQSMSEDADINVLMHRYGITGKFPDNPRIPVYGDFTEVTDYRSALEAIGRAQEAFLEYPPDFRAKFENDPQAFLEFCSRPENIPAMRDMGLMKTAPQPPNAATDPSAGTSPPAKPSGAPPANAPGGAGGTT